MKTLILGLGNPILGDDSVGPRVVDQLKTLFNDTNLTFKESCASGLDLLEEITGYDRLIIIDAIQTETGRVGQVSRLTLDDIVGPRFSGSPHSVDLATAVELGKKLGEQVPRRIDIFAVEVAEVNEFRESCTPEVEQAIPLVVDIVSDELNSVP